MRNHSNNDGIIAKRKFMSVCPFGLIELYSQDIIDCKLLDMLQLKLVFRKYGIDLLKVEGQGQGHMLEKNDTKLAFLLMFKLNLS